MKHTKHYHLVITHINFRLDPKKNLVVFFGDSGGVEKFPEHHQHLQNSLHFQNFLSKLSIKMPVTYMTIPKRTPEEQAQYEKERAERLRKLDEMANQPRNIVSVVEGEDDPDWAEKTWNHWKAVNTMTGEQQKKALKK